MDHTDRIIGQHMFTRDVLRDLMVIQCLSQDDPVEFAKARATGRLASADRTLGANPIPAACLYVQELETFWAQVCKEVEQRVALMRG